MSRVRSRCRLVADERRDTAVELLSEFAEGVQRRLVLVIQPLGQVSRRNIERSGHIGLADLLAELAFDGALESFASGHPEAFAYSERLVKRPFRFRERARV